MVHFPSFINVHLGSVKEDAPNDFHVFDSFFSKNENLQKGVLLHSDVLKLCNDIHY